MENGDHFVAINHFVTNQPLAAEEDDHNVEPDRQNVRKLLYGLFVLYATLNNRLLGSVQSVASNLGSTIVKFVDFTMTIMKGQFHCDDCGICRVGGRENFFQCKKCGSCYSVELRDNHLCVENSMKNHCPICYEFLFDSVKGSTIMNCGHTMHMECYTMMIHQNQYRCPICSKSVLNMSGTWQRLDLEIEATAMPEEYRYEVPIICNDCNSTGKTFFHILGHKCKHCNS